MNQIDLFKSSLSSVQSFLNKDQEIAVIGLAIAVIIGVNKYPQSLDQFRAKTFSMAVVTAVSKRLNLYLSVQTIEVRKACYSCFSRLVKTLSEYRGLTYLPRSWGFGENGLKFFTEQFPVEGQRSIIQWLEKNISDNKERCFLLRNANSTKETSRERTVRSSEIIQNFENYLALKVAAEAALPDASSSATPLV